MSRPALGKGLGALLGGASATPKAAPSEALAKSKDSPPPPTPVAPPGDSVLRVPLGQVRPCPFQPRKDFPPEALEELAASIREQGILQPLIVRPSAQGYELIAGERRWRAAQTVGLKEVPVIVREADDRKVLEMALIENLQRENLNPIEEAQGYAQLIEQFQLRQEDAATRVGKSRTVVVNALRLLRLPEPVQHALREARLSVGHAKVILGLPTAKEQQSAAERVMKDALTVRQTEELVARLLAPPAPGTPGTIATPATRDIHVVALEGRLRERFGTKVSVRYLKGKGSLEIKFFNDDDLGRILQLVGVSPD